MLATDQEHELLAAIVDHPDDTAQRLVFADLLLQRGEPWGELIALQCGQPADNPEHKARVKELLRDWQRFAGEAAPFCDRGAFRRGFVDRVGMTIADFARHGERVFSTQPVRELVISQFHWTAKQLDKLAQTPALRRVRRLWLGHKPGNKKTDPLGPLGASPHLARLGELVLHGCGTAPSDWIQMFAMIAPALRSVEVQTCRTSVDIYTAIADNPSLLAGLRAIDESRTWSVDNNDPGRPERLAASFARLARDSVLERLALAGNLDVTLDTLRPFFDGATRAALTHLDVLANMQSFDRDLFALLAASPKLARLESLSVNASAFAPDDIAPLLAAASLRTLRVWTAAWDDAVHARFVDVLLALPSDHTLAHVVLSHFMDRSSLRGRLEERFRVSMT